MINTQGRGLIHQELIVKTLQALKGPIEIAIVHIRSHQRGTNYYIRGNNLADEEAKKASLIQPPKSVLMLIQEKSENTLLDTKLYSPREIKTIQEIGAVFEQGKWVLPDQREILPKDYARQNIDQLHKHTHWGTKALSDHFLKYFGCFGIYEIAEQVTQGCLTCQRVNKKVICQTPAGGKKTAYRPFEKIQVDVTELPKRGKCKYLSVIIDQLAHWVKAFPAARAMAQTVAKVLLEQIILRFKVVREIDSDQGSHFTSRIIKMLIEALGIT